MVSIPLIAYGVILAVFGMPDEHTINWMFIGGPALLLLAAFSSIASGSKKAIKEAKAEKRAQYERWHAKEQSFSFDSGKMDAAERERKIGDTLVWCFGGGGVAECVLSGV